MLVVFCSCWQEWPRRHIMPWKCSPFFWLHNQLIIRKEDKMKCQVTILLHFRPREGLSELCSIFAVLHDAILRMLLMASIHVYCAAFKGTVHIPTQYKPFHVQVSHVTGTLNFPHCKFSWFFDIGVTVAMQPDPELIINVIYVCWCAVFSTPVVMLYSMLSQCHSYTLKVRQWLLILVNFVLACEDKKTHVPRTVSFHPY
jgi:hypothetical protein